jgi:ribosome-associated protein
LAAGRKTAGGGTEQGAAPVAPETLKSGIEAALDAAKAEDVVAIGLAGKSTVADYMVVASGRSHRQVAALAERVTEALRAIGAPVLSVEGLAASDWVLVDAGDVIVHLFRPEVRAFYALEKMWSVDLSAPRRGRREPVV